VDYWEQKAICLMINKTAGGVLHDSDTEQNLLRVAYFQYDTQTYTLVDL